MNQTGGVPESLLLLERVQGTLESQALAKLVDIMVIVTRAGRRRVDADQQHDRSLFGC